MGNNNETVEAALKLIRGWTWFAYVPEEAQRWLAEHAVPAKFARGQRVFGPGEPATRVFAVASGVFRIYLASPRGDEITLEEVVAGGWFPHMIPDKPVHAVHSMCQADASVFTFPMAAIGEFGKRWPGYYKGLYQEFTDRAGVILGRIELLSLHTLQVRLAVYLLRMAHLRGVPGKDGSILIPGGDGQAEVGARVGATRQRVNAALKAWDQRGWIAMDKDGIRLLDPERLRAEAKRSGFELDAYLAGWHGGWGGKPAP